VLGPTGTKRPLQRKSGEAKKKKWVPAMRRWKTKGSRASGPPVHPGPPLYLSIHPRLGNPFLLLPPRQDNLTSPHVRSLRRPLLSRFQYQSSRSFCEASPLFGSALVISLARHPSLPPLHERDRVCPDRHSSLSLTCSLTHSLTHSFFSFSLSPPSPVKLITSLPRFSFLLTRSGPKKRDTRTRHRPLRSFRL
jgi:hypothetical protein